MLSYYVKNSYTMYMREKQGVIMRNTMVIIFSVIKNAVWLILFLNFPNFLC